MFVAYRCPKGTDVWDALVRGFEAKDVPIGSPIEDVPIIGGLQFGSLEMLQRTVHERRDFLFVDGGYFLSWPPPRKWYRIVRGAYQKNWMDHIQPNRWERLGLELKPWRKGKFILICPPSDYVAKLFGFTVESWLESAMEQIRQVTDRPMSIRFKYAPGTINEALENAHCLVTWTSNTAVDALLEGVPVFVPRVSQAAPVACWDLSKIETPVYPDREPWAWSLAYGQFTVDEIASGFAKEIVWSQ